MIIYEKCFTFYGRDIDEEKIDLIKKITAERYDKNILILVI